VLSDAQWDTLQVPVNVAFFFFNSDSDVQRMVCFYPSPAGATESLLSLDTWDEIMAANPAFRHVVPDVEALLIYRPDKRRGSTASGDVESKDFQCFLVPITACYELVGRVRLQWRGFDGGQEVWEEIEAFFEKLRNKSELVKHEGELDEGAAIDDSSAR
jgi:hypothetical protein